MRKTQPVTRTNGLAQPPKRPPGRPRGSGHWNAEHAQSILARLRNGETLIAICAEPDMPSAPLVRAWATGQENPPIAGFAEAYAHARRQGHEVWAEQIVTIPQAVADGARAGNMAMVALAKLEVDSRKWLLSKLRPELYGDRLQIAQSGGSVTVNLYLPSKASLAPGDLADTAQIIDGTAQEVREIGPASEASSEDE